MLNKYRLPANTQALLITLTITTVIFIYNGCSRGGQQKAGDRIAEGAALSKKYCVSCHRYPEPALLDKITWEKGVLPNMAIQLGIQQEMGQYYADAHSAVNLGDWQKINAFYKDTAPVKLTIPKPQAVNDWAIFKLRQPLKTATNGPPAMTTMVKVNPFDHFIYTGDAGNNLYRWDSRLNGKLIKVMPSAVTAANFYKTATGENKGVFTCIGMLPPNDYLKGSMEQLGLNNKKLLKEVVTDSLPRPVQTAAADFNNDGLTDYVVCGFGNTRGGLFMVQQQADHSYKKKVIRAVPGAIQVETGDYNNDGWPDVMCLFAQADEGIWLFLNDQKGGFTTQNLLRFPPVYGSNSFQLVDMDNDGKKDIIYTCGDNNDYSSILKPYHGIYIFTNLGGFKYRRSFFYHINGASKAMAADFDGDGDMDIATIAFFADFQHHPAESFIYMEHNGTHQFKAHEVPVNKYGRWIAMDVADADNDGDQDIILGNFSIYEDKLNNQKGFKPNWDMHEPIVMLENITRKK